MGSREASLLVVLLVLAGCGGTGGGPSTLSVTPAPVPTTPSPSPTPGPPPGLSAGSVADPGALVMAHSAALGDRSYTVRGVETVRAPDGTLLSRRAVTVRVGPDHVAFHATVAASGPRSFRFAGRDPGRTAVWSPDGELVVAAFGPGDGRHERFRSWGLAGNDVASVGFWTDEVLPGARPWADIEPLFRAFPVRVVRVERHGGTRLYRARAGALVDAGVLAAAERVATARNATLRVTVDGRPVIRSYRLRYRAADHGAVLWVNRTVRYSEVGATSVDRPAWYGRAVEEGAVEDIKRRNGTSRHGTPRAGARTRREVQRRGRAHGMVRRSLFRGNRGGGGDPVGGVRGKSEAVTRRN